jgi:hypothetical protein
MSYALHSTKQNEINLYTLKNAFKEKKQNHDINYSLEKHLDCQKHCSIFA